MNTGIEKHTFLKETVFFLIEIWILGGQTMLTSLMNR